MKLHDYLKSPGALTVAQLREAIGARNDDQIRQWQHGYYGRLPSPENSAAIERATKGQVTCEELRPDDPWVRVKDRNWPWHPQGRPVLDVAREAA